jgi:hypothetical protein
MVRGLIQGEGYDWLQGGVRGVTLLKLSLRALILYFLRIKSI